MKEIVARQRVSFLYLFIAHHDPVQPGVYIGSRKRNAAFRREHGIREILAHQTVCRGLLLMKTMKSASETWALFW